ncbi:MAG: molybdopterin-dependent oxidoreductase [Planctomycetota bacterium]|nr:molybdopterin-dependent oxidoreductase [Planctomycetota bacterium]
MSVPKGFQPPDEGVGPETVSRSAPAILALTALALSEAVSRALQAPSLSSSVAQTVVNLLPGSTISFLVSALRSLGKPFVIFCVALLAVVLCKLLLVVSKWNVRYGLALLAVFLATSYLIASPVQSDESLRLMAVAFVTWCGTAVMLVRLNGVGRPAISCVSSVAEINRRKALTIGCVITLAPLALIASSRLRGRSRIGDGAVDGDLSATVEGLSRRFTSTTDFFRVDTALEVPRVRLDKWRIRISGMVKNPIDLSFSELERLDIVERSSTLVCVSNEVGGRLAGNALWSGILLDELLHRADPLPGAEQVLGVSIDGFSGGFPLAEVGQNGNSMIAIGMNGVELPAAHGFPARLIVPGIYGYVGATKWLTEIRLTSWEGADSYWASRGWAKQAPLKLTSRIDVPRRFAEMQSGLVVVAGVAWGREGISRVDVLLDGVPHSQAVLNSDVPHEEWVQWVALVDLPEGFHQISAQAFDGTGTAQRTNPIPPLPNGAEGLHNVPVFGIPTARAQTVATHFGVESQRQGARSKLKLNDR